MNYDADTLKRMALHWLREQHPQAVLLCELGLGTYSSGGRLDVAAITPTEIVAIEVKGDGDSHARLELQGERYATACGHTWLLTAPGLEKACHQRRPRFWGLLAVSAEGASIEARMGAADQSERNCPGALWWMLWSAERAVAWKNACSVHRGLSAKPANAAPEYLALADLRQIVIDALRARDWRHDGQYAKAQVWLPGEALPPIQSLTEAA